MAVTWDESLATGSADLDRQHQELFRQVAVFSDAIKQGKVRDEIRKILDFLEQYIAQHFAEEEGLMEELHCPAADANKADHARFISMYRSLRREFNWAGASPSLVPRIHDLLSRWLVQHIGRIDVQLREYCGPVEQSLVGATDRG